MLRILKLGREIRSVYITDILDILNPTLYHKVKSIEIELGASDDEDILDKSIKVQTALPSRKQ